MSPATPRPGQGALQEGTDTPTAFEGFNGLISCRCRSVLSRLVFAGGRVQASKSCSALILCRPKVAGQKIAILSRKCRHTAALE